MAAWCSCVCVGADLYLYELNKLNTLLVGITALCVSIVIASNPAQKLRIQRNEKCKRAILTLSKNKHSKQEGGSERSVRCAHQK